MSVLHERLVIIGSGPAGYTAAIYAARAMLTPLVIAGMQPGGQLTITTDVENYPGFATGVMGPDLMEAMKHQAEHCGARVEHDLVAKVDFSARPFRLWYDSGKELTADAVIIATGAQAKWLGLPSEQKFQGYGVSACATCDGFFYRNKPILVVGGGNTAVEEALFLTNFAAQVTVIHRRDSFKAERIMQDRLFAHPKITVKWDTTLDEVLGSEMPPKVTGARLRNVKTGATEEIAVDGIFIAIGHAPSVEVFRPSGLRFKDNGYLWVEPGTPKTNIEGVFACGDVTDDIYRQAVTAAGMGCMAALDAERFLAHFQS